MKLQPLTSEQCSAIYEAIAQIPDATRRAGYSYDRAVVFLHKAKVRGTPFHLINLASFASRDIQKKLSAIKFTEELKDNRYKATQGDISFFLKVERRVDKDRAMAITEAFNTSYRHMKLDTVELKWQAFLPCYPTVLHPVHYQVAPLADKRYLRDGSIMKGQTDTDEELSRKCVRAPTGFQEIPAIENFKGFPNNLYKAGLIITGPGCLEMKTRDTSKKTGKMHTSSTNDTSSQYGAPSQKKQMPTPTSKQSTESTTMTGTDIVMTSPALDTTLTTPPLSTPASLSTQDLTDNTATIGITDSMQNTFMHLVQTAEYTDDNATTTIPETQPDTHILEEMTSSNMPRYTCFCCAARQKEHEAFLELMHTEPFRGKSLKEIASNRKLSESFVDAWPDSESKFKTLFDIRAQARKEHEKDDVKTNMKMVLYEVKALRDDMQSFGIDLAVKCEASFLPFTRNKEVFECFDNTDGKKAFRLRALLHELKANIKPTYRSYIADALGQIFTQRYIATHHWPSKHAKHIQEGSQSFPECFVSWFNKATGDVYAMYTKAGFDNEAYKVALGRYLSDARNRATRRLGLSLSEFAELTLEWINVRSINMDKLAEKVDVFLHNKNRSRPYKRSKDKNENSQEKKKKTSTDNKSKESHKSQSDTEHVYEEVLGADWSDRDVPASGASDNEY